MRQASVHRWKGFARSKSTGDASVSTKKTAVSRATSCRVCADAQTGSESGRGRRIERRLCVMSTRGSTKSNRRPAARHDGDLERPAWLRGYVCWEHRLEHHDPLTDVFSLGLILASLACSLDLTDPEDHRRFVAHRSNLFELTPDLHPVLAKAIRAMTELDRHKRPQDLQSLSRLLENYRDHEVDFETDLARNRGFGGEAPPAKRRIILDKLRERLFEVSRRNRLLDFQPTMQSVNLTQASIPLVFDYRNVPRRSDRHLEPRLPRRRFVRTSGFTQ